jgi:hypothetical protein
MLVKFPWEVESDNFVSDRTICIRFRRTKRGREIEKWGGCVGIAIEGVGTCDVRG